MSSPTPVLVENTPHDRHAVSDIMVRAYHSSNAFYRTIYPPPAAVPELISRQTMRWGKNLTIKNECHMKLEVDELTDNDNNNDNSVVGQAQRMGKIVSYARWEFPERVQSAFPMPPEVDTKEMEVLEKEFRAGCADEGEWPWGFDKAYVDVTEEELDMERDRWFKDKEAITLVILVTDPTSQGRGAGSTHLRWGAQIADAVGLPIFLEATESGRGLYERFGFKSVAEVKHDLALGKGGEVGVYVHHLMIREPVTPS